MSSEALIHDAINRIKKIRYDLEGDDLSQISDELGKVEEFKGLCLEIAEEAIEKELQAEAVQARINEMTERKNRLNRTADTLRTLVLQCMEIRGESKIPSPALTLSVANRKGDLVIDDEAIVPARFFKPQPPKLDKKMLKDAVIGDGEIIEGTHISNGSTSLTIRRK